MKILVVGFGSIGARHVRVASELGWFVSVLSRRPRPDGVTFAWHERWSEAVAEVPDLVLIATETNRHRVDLELLAATGYGGPVLVEKPLLSRRGELEEFAFSRVACAYVLRFHPLLAKLRGLLALDESPVMMMHAYCGQNLADWRPGQDYRASYSASREAGGGVLRDLSHELDYVMWLMSGRPSFAFAQGGNLGVLGIVSDESWAIQLQYPGQPGANVSVTINYLDRPAKRFLTAATHKHSYQLDFIAQKLFQDGVEVETTPVHCDDIYRAQLRAFAENDDSLCSLEEACDVLDLIEAIEQSGAQGKWISL